MANIELPLGDSGETFKVPEWATEETQKEILAFLSKKSPSGKKQEEETKKSTESLKRLSDITKKTREDFRKMGDAIDDTTKSLDEIEASAESTTKGLLKVVGGLGALGSALGFVAGTFDAFVDAQVAAIQSGFSFSNQLIESRANLARIGLNFTQFSAILAENGESLRMLGRNGEEATSRFSDLITTAREATEGMGYYGLTSEEIAGEIADLTGTLVRAGVVGDELFSTAADSFNLLNREVLGYARLTGQNRRELMRNREQVDADSMFMSLMNDVGGAGGVAIAQNMTDMATAAFGPAASGMIDIIKAAVVEAEKGIPMMTSEMMSTLEMTGMRDVVLNYANDLVASAGNQQEAFRITEEFAARSTQHLQAQEDYIRDQLIIMNAGGVAGPLAAELQLLMDAVAGSRVLAENMENPEERQAAFLDGLSETTETLLQFKSEMEIFIQNARAGLLALFGVDEFGALSDINFRQMGEDMNAMIQDILEWKDRIFGEDGIGTTTWIAGIAALFVLPSVVAGTIAAIAGLFTTRAVIAALAGAVTGLFSNRGLPGMGGTGPQQGNTRPRPGTRPSPRPGFRGPGPLGLLFTMMNMPEATPIPEEVRNNPEALAEFQAEMKERRRLREAGMENTLRDTPVIGQLMEGYESMFEWIHGHAPRTMNETEEEYNARVEAANPPIPAFDPASQRITTDNMIQGVNATQTGEILPGNIDPSVAWRFNEQQLEEMRKMREAAERSAAAAERMAREFRE